MRRAREIMSLLGYDCCAWSVVVAVGGRSYATVMTSRRSRGINAPGDWVSQWWSHTHHTHAQREKEEEKESDGPETPLRSL